MAEHLMAPHDRKALRTQLLAARAAWLLSPAGHAGAAALGHHLREVLTQLEPQCLGVFWPLEGEFNAAAYLQGLALQDAPAAAASIDDDDPAYEDSDDEDDAPRGLQLHRLDWALPYAYKAGERCMEYRRWDGQPPSAQDECGIPTSTGAPVLPDVVLVPCVGFTREGYRLGYGGGYFDRWLAAHPGVISIGLAWSVSEVAFAVESHDQALTLLLTEKEVISP